MKPPSTRGRRVPRLSYTMAGLIVILSTNVAGSELIYTPVNPAFGGHPANGENLLNLANVQNNYSDPDVPDNPFANMSPLDQFDDMLQRSIIGRLSAAATNDIIDAEGNLREGTIETTDFTIVIIDLGNGLLQVTTTDKLTGQSTTFQVSSTL